MSQALTLNRHGGESRSLLALRVLAAARKPLSTPQIAAAAGEHCLNRQRLLTRYGTVLRAREKGGQVRKTGTTPGSYHNVPTVLWEITPAGRAALRQHDKDTAAAPARAAAAAAAETARAAEAVQVAMTRRQVLIQAAAQAAQGPVTPEDRGAYAVALRALGCSLQAIGDAFGVSRECIRLDLLPPAELAARRAAELARYHRNAAAAKAKTS